MEREIELIFEELAIRDELKKKSTELLESIKKYSDVECAIDSLDTSSLDIAKNRSYFLGKARLLETLFNEINRIITDL